jgi:[ribosomal protein S18]-alanine N-acetyltransferase
MNVPGEKISDSSAVTVRPMSSLDVSAALSILEESPEASTWSREALLESASKGIAWAAELDGRVAGILIGQAAADEFEILNLAVGKLCRRRGVATHLVNAAVDWSRASGARQAYLEVRASNEGGTAFYARMGFHVCGRRPDYYRNPTEDAVLLVFHNRAVNP